MSEIIQYLSESLKLTHKFEKFEEFKVFLDSFTKGRNTLVVDDFANDILENGLSIEVLEKDATEFSLPYRTYLQEETYEDLEDMASGKPPRIYTDMVPTKHPYSDIKYCENRVALKNLISGSDLELQEKIGSKIYKQSHWGQLEDPFKFDNYIERRMNNIQRFNKRFSSSVNCLVKKHSFQSLFEALKKAKLMYIGRFNFESIEDIEDKNHFVDCELEDYMEKKMVDESKARKALLKQFTTENKSSGSSRPCYINLSFKVKLVILQRFIKSRKDQNGRMREDEHNILKLLNGTFMREKGQEVFNIFEHENIQYDLKSLLSRKNNFTIIIKSIKDMNRESERLGIRIENKVYYLNFTEGNFTDKRSMIENEMYNKYEAIQMENLRHEAELRNLKKRTEEEIVLANNYYDEIINRITTHQNILQMNALLEINARTEEKIKNLKPEYEEEITMKEKVLVDTHGFQFDFKFREGGYYLGEEKLIESDEELYVSINARGDVTLAHLYIDFLHSQLRQMYLMKCIKDKGMKISEALKGRDLIEDMMNNIQTQDVIDSIKDVTDAEIEKLIDSILYTDIKNGHIRRVKLNKKLVNAFVQMIDNGNKIIEKAKFTGANRKLYEFFIKINKALREDQYIGKEYSKEVPVSRFKRIKDEEVKERILKKAEIEINRKKALLEYSHKQELKKHEQEHEEHISSIKNQFNLKKKSLEKLHTRNRLAIHKIRTQEKSIETYYDSDASMYYTRDFTDLSTELKNLYDLNDSDFLQQEKKIVNVDKALKEFDNRVESNIHDLILRKPLNAYSKLKKSYTEGKISFETLRKLQTKNITLGSVENDISALEELARLEEYYKELEQNEKRIHSELEDEEEEQMKHIYNSDTDDSDAKILKSHFKPSKTLKSLKKRINKIKKEKNIEEDQRATFSLLKSVERDHKTVQLRKPSIGKGKAVQREKESSPALSASESEKSLTRSNSEKAIEKSSKEFDKQLTSFYASEESVDEEDYISGYRKRIVKKDKYDSEGFLRSSDSRDSFNPGTPKSSSLDTEEQEMMDLYDQRERDVLESYRQRWSRDPRNPDRDLQTDEVAGSSHFAGAYESNSNAGDTSSPELFEGSNDSDLRKGLDYDYDSF